MQIELNGMYYILNVRADAVRCCLMAEIVDEGFHGPVRRAQVDTLGDVVRLIRGYTGLKPDGEVLHQVSGLLEDRLDGMMAFAGEPAVLQKAG